MIRAIRTSRIWTIAAVIVVAVGMIVVTDSPAHAAPVAADSYTDLTDTAGNSVDNYKLSLDGGSSWNLTDTKKFWKPLIELVWDLYKLNVSLQISELDTLLEAGWLTTLIAPLRGITSGINSIMDTIGLETLMLTVLGLVVAFLMFRGRSGAAVTELMIGCIIFGLGATYFADPADSVSKDGGYISRAQDAGDDIVAELFPDESTDTLKSSLVDTLIRGPHQFINYGASLDGTECEETYNESLGKDDAWKTVGDCNESYKTAAQDVGSSKLAFLAVGLMPTQMGFSGFSKGIVLLFVVFVVGAAWQAVKLTWTSVTGIVSGGGRRSFMRALMMLVVALASIALTQTAVVIWMKIVQVAFSSEIDISLPMRFMFASSLLIIGPIAIVIIYIRARKSAKAAADSMSKLGAGKGAARPLNIGQGAMRATSVAKDMAMFAAMRGKSKAPQTPAEPVTVTSKLNTPENSSPAAPPNTELPQRPAPKQITSGKGGGGAVPTPTPGPPSGGKQSEPESTTRTRKPSMPTTSSSGNTSRQSKIVKTVKTAGRVGLAAATGGMSAAATTAGRIALSSAVSRGLSAKGRSKPSATPSNPRRNGPRETALRNKLAAAQRPVSYTARHGRLVDGQTGQAFEHSRVGSAEILTPTSATTTGRKPGSRSQA